MATYFVTGAAGYVGTRMLQGLLQHEPDCRIVGVDVRPLRLSDARLEAHVLDVRDPGLAGLVRATRPDAVLHFAFVLDPIYDEREMSDIDLGGTRNVLDAVARARVPYLLATSSTTAYGALADNPPLLTEEHPVRAAASFVYAHDKRQMDEMLQQFAASHPETAVCVVRPCIVLGPDVANYIAATMLRMPLAARLDGADGPTQFIHEDDLFTLLTTCIARRARGTYNAVGDGTLTTREMAAIQGKRSVALPLAVVRALTWAVWRARLLPYALPPGVLDFFRWPWVASNAKAKRELGWQPQHTSADCFRLIVARKQTLLQRFDDKVRAAGRR